MGQEWSEVGGQVLDFGAECVDLSVGLCAEKVAGLTSTMLVLILVAGVPQCDPVGEKKGM